MDVRIRDRLLRKGKVSNKEVDSYLASLPDAEAKADWIDYEARFEAERADQEAEEAEQAQEQAANLASDGGFAPSSGSGGLPMT